MIAYWVIWNNEGLCFKSGLNKLSGILWQFAVFKQWLFIECCFDNESLCDCWQKVMNRLAIVYVTGLNAWHIYYINGLGLKKTSNESAPLTLVKISTWWHIHAVQPKQYHSIKEEEKLLSLKFNEWSSADSCVSQRVMGKTETKGICNHPIQRNK